MQETNRIEFKRELSDRFERSVVSFLNYAGGGEILIGVTDNGDAVGVNDADAFSELLTESETIYGRRHLACSTSLLRKSTARTLFASLCRAVSSDRSVDITGTAGIPRYGASSARRSPKKRTLGGGVNQRCQLIAS